jgi:Mg-chelatase subunit ChlD
MKNICNLILIDASGSMQNRVSDVKGGLMKLFSDIREQKDINQHTIVCDFSDDFKVLINSINTKDLDTSVIEKYKTRGGTALFDAIKESFNMIPKGMDGVFVSILTDGEENASKTCTSEDAKKLISSGKENKWGITFMGCDEKALDVAKNIGITNTFAFMNDTAGYEKMSKARGSSFTSYVASIKSMKTKDDIQTENLFNNSAPYIIYNDSVKP